MKNELTKLLDIERPVILGGMMELSKARLAAAVSNAGGLGTLGQRMNLDNFREDLIEIKKLTDKPFSVNMPLHAPDIEEKLNMVIEEGVKVVTTAAGNPKRIMDQLKAAGITVLHVVASAEQAKKVADAGVDAVIAEGGESGGLVSKNRVSTMVLIPDVCDAVKIPVIAAGGICDERGLMAALSLGAQGVQLGTRFLVCDKSNAPDEWKTGIINARAQDSEVVPRGPVQARMLKDSVANGITAGSVSGLIHSDETVDNIVKNMVLNAESVLENLNGQIKN
jgi:enoyl-[acyl-carrier protein] reductase II